jgi:hypothetical protein
MTKQEEDGGGPSMAEMSEVFHFSSENYEILEIVCGRSMVSVIANYEEKPEQPEEPLTEILKNYSHRELPALNIEELIEKSKRKTSRESIKQQVAPPVEEMATPQPRLDNGSKASAVKPMSSDQKEFLQSIYEKYLKIDSTPQAEQPDSAP